MAYLHITHDNANDMAACLLNGTKTRSDLAAQYGLQQPEVSRVLKKFGHLETVRGTKQSRVSPTRSQNQFKRDPNNAKTKLYDLAIRRVMAGESAYRVQKSLPELNYQYLTRLVKKHRDETEKTTREHPLPP